MTVLEAIDVIRGAGELKLEGNRIRARLPRQPGPVLEKAIAVLRSRKQAALAALNEQNLRVAASTFVKHAGARLTCARPRLNGATGFVIVVPLVNDDQDFREAIRILGMDQLSVIARIEPLAVLSH